MSSKAVPDLAASSTFTGADAAFFSLVEQLAERLSPSIPSLSRAELKRKLTAFHPQFRELHARALQRHVPGDALPGVLRALQSAAMQRYVEARGKMAPALQAGLAKLVLRMGQTPL